MSVWFTSDLHLSHPRVAGDRAQAAGVVWPSTHYTQQEREKVYIAWHDGLLERNWDASVKPGDQVWVLGDLTVGGTEAVARALNWIADRPGVKHLIPGNHDPVHPMYRDAHKWQPAFLKVFASVQPFARRRIGGRSVLLSHLPYPNGGDHTEGERFTQYRLRDEGLILLHGHTHSRDQWSYTAPPDWPHLTEFAITPQIHVGVDAWQMAPVHLDVIAELIAVELPSRPAL